MDERIRELEKRWLDERNKLMDGMIRISALADKWNLECDELREDNKRLATERDALREAGKCALKAFEYIKRCNGMAVLDPIGLDENLALLRAACRGKPGAPCR